MFMRRRDTQHKDIQHNDTQHNSKKNATPSIVPSGIMLTVLHAEWRVFDIVILSVIMLNVVMLNVVAALIQSVL